MSDIVFEPNSEFVTFADHCDVDHSKTMDIHSDAYESMDCEKKVDVMMDGYRGYEAYEVLEKRNGVWWLTDPISEGDAVLTDLTDERIDAVISEMKEE